MLIYNLYVFSMDFNLKSKSRFVLLHKFGIELWLSWYWYCPSLLSFCSHLSDINSRFLKKILFILERHTERGRDIGRGKSKLPEGSPLWDSIPGPQDQDPSWRQTLNCWATQSPEIHHFKLYGSVVLTIFRLVQPSPLSHSKTFSSPLKGTPYTVSSHSSFLSPPTQPATHLSLWNCLFWTFHLNRIT